MKRLAVAALAPLSFLVFSVVPAQAVTPTCNGLEATIVGTDDADDLDGTEGDDVVYLGDGADTFDGLSGNDVICGGTGDDRITPGAGGDTVFAETGNDKVYEGPGTDYLDGGDGPSDSLLYSRWTADADLRLDSRIGQATTSDGTDSFKNFTHYVGTTASDTLIGSRKDQLIDGYGGSDTIYGFGGNDRIYIAGYSSIVDAGDGNDGVQAGSARYAKVRLGSGDDYLFFTHVRRNWFDGGAGSDSLVARGNSMEINLNQDFVLEYSSTAHMAILGFENATGSFGNDRLVGNAASNRLSGSAGNDRFYALEGDDVIDGGSGDNHANGGPGNDACVRTQVEVNCER